MILQNLFTKSDGTKYNFNAFALPLKFVEKIYSYEITLDEAKDDQDKLEKLKIRLEKYKPKINKKKRRGKKCSKIVSCERRSY